MAICAVGVRRWFMGEFNYSSPERGGGSRRLTEGSLSAFRVSPAEGGPSTMLRWSPIVGSLSPPDFTWIAGGNPTRRSFRGGF